MAAHSFKPVGSGPSDWHRCDRCGLMAVHFEHPSLEGAAYSYNDMVAVLAPDVPFDQVGFPCSPDSVS